MQGPTKVRGKLLEIDAPAPAERDWIFASLAAPDVHVPLGCREPPSRTLFDAELLELWRGDTVRREPVRFHVLRRLDDRRPVGFFLDFGWDYPHDSTREIDLAFPRPEDRGIGTYLDATVIVAQYLFTNGLAKRLRWRVDAGPRGEPRRSQRQGARLLLKQEERHPLTGEWVVKYVYEFAAADFEAFGRMAAIDLRTEYGRLRASVWETYRRLRSGAE